MGLAGFSGSTGISRWPCIDGVGRNVFSLPHNCNYKVQIDCIINQTYMQRCWDVTLLIGHKDNGAPAPIVPMPLHKDSVVVVDYSFSY